jgi:phospholipase D1/2
MKASALIEGTTCHALSTFDRARVLVDAESYYSSFCQAALAARRYIYISGWQFDTQARLLRPDPSSPLPHPLELLPFLNYLCEATPALEIYITAWDYSVIYALEREWLQKLRFDFQSHSRVHFEFLNHPEPGGCHHQKLVIIDGQVAFLGGLDLCDSRWDTRAHEKDDPARIDVHGRPYKPFHDIQVALEGPVIDPLERVFLEGWRMAGGLDPVRPHPTLPRAEAAPDTDAPKSEIGPFGLPISSRHVAISLTDWTESGQHVGEIQALFERAILAAERLIYIETQYFTSKALAEALYYRLSDPSRTKLSIVLVMPDGADSPKEDFVLGNRQRSIRRFVADVARHFGHELRLLMSSDATDDQPCPATFIHSKLMIIDDELLTIGSANFTNRSMRVDRELNVAWQTWLESDADAARLRSDIQRLRASLLAEHAGVDDEGIFLEIDGLIERIDGVCGTGRCKLHCQSMPAPEGDDPLLIAIFDPSGPIDWDSIDQSLENAFEFDEGFVKRTAQQIGQRLGVVDIE